MVEHVLDLEGYMRGISLFYLTLTLGSARRGVSGVFLLTCYHPSLGISLSHSLTCHVSRSHVSPVIGDCADSRLTQQWRNMGRAHRGRTNLDMPTHL